MRRLLALVALLVATAPPLAPKTVLAQGHTTKTSRYAARRAKAPAARHDDHGRIQRSAAARHAFARQTGYPHGRPGYVIDHIVPLACGGRDEPSNMQWQTIAEGKAKDKTERKGC